MVRKSPLPLLGALLLSLFFLGGTPAYSKSFEPANRISVVYDGSSSSEHQEIARALEAVGVFEALAEALSELFILPEEITLRFTSLDEENAYWDPETNEIQVGYELISTYSQLFEVDSNDPDALAQEYVDAAFFTVLHEVGHALVALLDLPITGREEDAVDEFATILLLLIDSEQTEAALISALEQFAFDADRAEIDDSSFADEHSLDLQRYYAVLMLVHGSNPEKYQYLVEEGLLSEDKAEQSASEFERKCAVWDALLAPHLR